MPLPLFRKLFGYQKHGVAWMWSLHASCPVPAGRLGRGYDGEASAIIDAPALRPIKASSARAAVGHKVTGGVLADDMGLGKTVMGVAFITSLFHSNHINAALIVAPVSIVSVWESEFKAWAPEIRVRTFHGSVGKGEAITTVMSKGGVVITTYGMVSNNPDMLGADAEDVLEYWAANKGGDAEAVATPARSRSKAPRTPAGLARDVRIEWDVLICDEGHKIKNPSTQMAKSLRIVPSTYRLLLTGTPLQNNLDELWALFDFVSAGQLLGTRRVFNRDIAGVILRARDRTAGAAERMAGQAAYERLSAILQPHMLRREKAKLQSRTARAAVDGVTDQLSQLQLTERAAASAAPIVQSAMGDMGEKKELVLWVTLSAEQLRLYNAFLTSDAVAHIRGSSHSPLTAITVLRNITSHPLLLSGAFRDAVAAPGGELSTLLDSEQTADEAPSALPSAAQAWQPYVLPDAAALTAAAGKMDVLMHLLRKLVDEGHKVLVFSQSRRMLDIMEKCICTAHGRAACSRIDGGMAAPERQAVVASFNSSTKLRVCLLTTGVGAHGLTLTSADRVVIYDPSWNPAVDAQAVDRAYRVGQRSDVITYRLISAGTVEESMYRLQVFKSGMSTSVMSATTNRGMGGEAKRLLSVADLKDVFVLGDTTRSATADMVAAIADAPVSMVPGIKRHLQRIHEYTSTSCCGVSHHDSLFALSDAERLELMTTAASAADATDAAAAMIGDDSGPRRRVKQRKRVEVSPESTPPPAARRRAAVAVDDDSEEEAETLHDASQFAAAADGYDREHAASVDDSYQDIIDTTTDFVPAAPLDVISLLTPPQAAPLSWSSPPQDDEEPQLTPMRPAATFPSTAPDYDPPALADEDPAPADESSPVRAAVAATTPMDDMAAALDMLDACSHGSATCLPTGVRCDCEMRVLRAARSLGWEIPLPAATARRRQSDAPAHTPHAMHATDAMYDEGM